MKYVFIEPGVGTWRTAWPAEELKRRGYDADYYVAGKMPADVGPGPLTIILHYVNRAWNFNGRWMTGYGLAEYLRQFGRLIVQFDDDLTRLYEIQPKPWSAAARRVALDVPAAAKIADKVIVATPRLAEVFGRWNDVAVAENYLPEWVLDLPRRERIDRLGWMGEMGVHRIDWEAFAPYCKDLPPLHLIGPGQEGVDMLRAWGARDVTATDITLDLRELYGEMGRVRAAIIPLKDFAFNRAKSWIKPMEFMARGVQPVAAAHPDYERLHAFTGALLTYADPRDLLAAAIEAYECRQDDGLAARLRDGGLLMERAGGDAWEQAIAA